MRKKLQPVILVCLCLLFHTAKAQSVSMDSLKARYQNETLHYFKGYLSKGENGERIRHADLKNEFSFSVEGMKEFEIYRSKTKISTILLLSTLSLFIVSISTINSNKDLSAGFYVGALVCDLSAIPFAISSRKKLQHAIWLRNRDVVFR